VSGADCASPRALSQRRLIIRPGAIGDCILALPAMEHLRAAYTEVWVPARSAPLIRFADCVRGISSTGLDLLGLPDREPPRGLLDLLAQFDSIVSWYGTNRPEFHAAMARLPFTSIEALPDADCSLHAADFYLMQARRICADGTWSERSAIPRIECARTAPSGQTDLSARFARDRSSGYIVIHPFSGSAKKNWPLERYRQVARQLGDAVRWCAGPEDELAEAVRFENLYEVACWLAGARLYIGNDSGITHLAAAAGTPVLALFGPTEARVWAPRGERVQVLARMESLNADDVVAAARELLRATG